MYTTQVQIESMNEEEQISMVKTIAQHDVETPAHDTESFVKFDDTIWATDHSQRIIRKVGADQIWTTAYGKIPLHCDGHSRGIYHFEFSIDNKPGFICIGIDSNRTNINQGFHCASSYHYALDSSGWFYHKKGTLHYIRLLPLCETRIPKSMYHSLLEDCKECKRMDFVAKSTIKMRVDIGQRKISFAVNNAKYREMATIRQSDSSYFLAVAADWEDSQITLTKFYIENDDDDIKTKENEVVVKQKSIEESSPDRSMNKAEVEETNDWFPLRIRDSSSALWEEPIVIAVQPTFNISAVKQLYCQRRWGHQVPLSLSYRGQDLTPDNELLVNFGIVQLNDVAILATYWNPTSNRQMPSFDEMVCYL